jgi:hypothetical protein
VPGGKAAALQADRGAAELSVTFNGEGGGEAKKGAAEAQPSGTGQLTAAVEVGASSTAAEAGAEAK